MYGVARFQKDQNDRNECRTKVSTTCGVLGAAWFGPHSLVADANKHSDPDTVLCRIFGIRYPNALIWQWVQVTAENTANCLACGSALTFGGCSPHLRGALFLPMQTPK
jgi:hypothetical protein